MKRNILLSLLIGMMGVMALSGCEKKYTTKNVGIDTIKKHLVGEWKCTDTQYSDGELKVTFYDDSISSTSTVSRSHVFNYRNKEIVGYEVVGDSIKIYFNHNNGNEQYVLCQKFAFTLRDTHLRMEYDGMLPQYGNGPLHIYHFRKTRGR